MHILYALSSNANVTVLKVAEDDVTSLVKLELKKTLLVEYLIYFNINE